MTVMKSCHIKKYISEYGIINECLSGKNIIKSNSSDILLDKASTTLLNLTKLMLIQYLLKIG